MRILSFLTLVLLVVLSISGEAQACDCLDLTPQQSFQQAAVVFEGELIRSTQIKDGSSFGRNIMYTFAVTKLLKGPAVSEIMLVGGQTDCDFYFFPNTVYRVYARSHEGQLSTGSCLANQALWTRRMNSLGVQTTFPWRFWSTKALVAGIAVLTLLIVGFLLRGLRPQRS